MIIPFNAEQAQLAADAALAVNIQVYSLCSLLQGEVRVFDESSHKPFTIGLGLSPDLDLTDLPEVERDPKGDPKLYTFIDPKLHWIFKHPDHEFVKKTLALSLCAQIGFFYEEIKQCDTRKPEPNPIIDFLRHVRNAAFHGNTFKITSKTVHAMWRGKRIDADMLNGKPLFFNFLAPGDVYLLISDVLSIAQEGTTSPITLTANE